MKNTEETLAVEKLETGIAGFDLLSNGGLPKGRATLVAGTTGSAKTIFAVQFLAEGIVKAGESGVFVTFEETPADIRRNMKSFGWDIAAWEAEGKWAFVDASPEPAQGTVVVGQYDLGALLVRVEHAVRKVDAGRLSMDSLSAAFNQVPDAATVRLALFRVASALRSLGVTVVLTAERTDDYGKIARYGVEEFVADNVVIFRNVLEEEKRRRTMEVLKFRGTTHQKGEWPFTIASERGIVVIPLSGLKLDQRSSNIRTTSGNKDLDRMCGGGFFRDSIIFASGATGVGKTLLTTEFIAGAAEGERSLLFAFEESREQFFRNAIGWGIDLLAMEDAGRLKVVCEYPEVAGPEDHLIRMKSIIEEFKPSRVAVDSLSAFEPVSTRKSSREFVIGLTSFIKHKEIVGLFTATTPTLVGGTSTTDAHMFPITDSIILLRYVELFGEIRRDITVLKMRGSMHDKDIREFSIDGDGMHIGKPLRNVTGILAGNPTLVTPREAERVADLFKEEAAQT